MVMMGSAIAQQHGSSDQPGSGRAVLTTPRQGRWAGGLKLKQRTWEGVVCKFFPFLRASFVLKSEPLLSSTARPAIDW